MARDLRRLWPLAAVMMPVAALGVSLALQAGSGDLFPYLGLVATGGLLGVWLMASAHRRSQRELDISRREVAAAHARLAHHEHEGRRFADLGVLAAGIAHELGQPLSAARVDIEGLHLLRQLGREVDQAHSQRVLSRVGTCVLAMTQIVGHLRDLAADPQQAALQTLDLSEVVRAVLSERGRWDISGATTIAWDPPATPIMARAEPLGLRLVLVNLLRNACEAVADAAANGQVRIVIGLGPRIEVHDSGPGIPAERLARIFDPFSSTKGGSRGIGLCLARASAERMQAHLTVVSAVGEGTVFTIELLSP